MSAVRRLSDRPMSISLVCASMRSRKPEGTCTLEEPPMGITHSDRGGSPR